MDWNTILAIVGLVVTVASLVYAWRTNREKEDLRKLINAELKGLAGNIGSVNRSARWADHHFRGIREQTVKLQQNDTVCQILKHALDGARDATAAARMAQNLLNQVLSLQEGMFGTREVVHPDDQGPDPG